MLSLKAPEVDSGPDAVSVLSLYAAHAFHLYSQTVWKGYEHDVKLSLSVDSKNEWEVTLSTTTHTRPELAKLVIDKIRESLRDENPAVPFRQLFTRWSEELNKATVDGEVSETIVPAWIFVEGYEGKAPKSSDVATILASLAKAVLKGPS